MRNSQRFKAFFVRYKVLLIVAVAIAVVGVSAGLLFNLLGEEAPATVIKGQNEEKSQILVTGENYSMNYDADEESDQDDKIDNKKEDDKSDDKDEKEKEKEENKELEIAAVNENNSDNGKTKVPGSQGNGHGVGHSAGGGFGTGFGTGIGQGSGHTNSGGSGIGEAEEEGKEPEIETSKSPTIECSLRENVTYEGARQKFTVLATSYRNVKISSFNYRVYVNGASDALKSVSSYPRPTYMANFKHGMNTVVIKVKDDDGNEAAKVINIDVNAEVGNRYMGKVYVTVDAINLLGDGEGVFISDKAVDLHEGDSVSDVVNKVLLESGMQPIWDDPSAKTYLSGIKIPGVLKGKVVNYELTPEFEAQLEGRIGSAHLNGVYEENELSEKHFTAQSGWLYSQNGKVNLFGMSEAPVSDTDEIRLFYVVNRSQYGF